MGKDLVFLSKRGRITYADLQSISEALKKYGDLAMSRFIVFDVETPNRLNHRMSAIGITVIDGGAITENFYSLVDPETHFDYFNTRLTGINEETVKDAPTFPELWAKIEPLMSSGILVAHNAVFDMGVLKKCLNGYDIFWKQSAKYLCTVQVADGFCPE